MSGTVLVSTHDLPTAGELREGFRGERYAVELVTPGEDLSGVEDPVLLILTDGEGEGARGLLKQAREARVPAFAMVEGGEEDRRSAMREMGLQEVFSPEADVGEVLLLGRTLIERRRLQRITGIIGETEPIREALERVVQIAPVDATVLVTGESGTGKELVARGIHALSPRRHGPFIPVNVAALSETLLESELFGHEKGAFTGAVDSRRGLFEIADGGTIFLDEIGEMPLSTQTKLLRVLEQQEFLRVGGERPLQVDVRIVTATNQKLRQLVATGDFRRDLYYRLNVLSIELPPLRQRRQDIPLLVQAFIEEAAARNDREFRGISPEAMEILMDYSWPGNVRELRNLVESMVVLAPGHEISPADIPEEVREPDRSRLLPVPAPPRGAPLSGGDERAYRPELEFVFRTLVDLRLDVDDLRREFEVYRKEARGPHEVGVGRAVSLAPDQREIRLEVAPPGEREAIDSAAAGAERDGGERPDGPPAEGTGEDGVVLYRPGMTMEDVEREAIRTALDEVGGNRRKAAESLGIGERTLYRKIRKYDLD